MAIAKKHFKKSSQQGADDGIRFEGRPHRVVIISANLSARPSMNSRDGSMSQQHPRTRLKHEEHEDPKGRFLTHRKALCAFKI
jgi:hypothetical protein